MEPMYRSAAGRAALLDLRDRTIRDLDVPCEQRELETRHGRTAVLLCGPSDAPPLVLLHGVHGNAALIASACQGLAARLRCIFVDVPGEPNRSSSVRLNKSDGSCGAWMSDLLDGLELTKAALLGISGGGYMVVRICASIGSRIDRAVLVVPEGFARPRVWPYVRDLLWPALRHRWSPTPEHARRFTEGLCAPAEVSATMLEHTTLVLQHVAASPNLGPRFTDAELARCRMPIYLIAGGRDVLFPGDRTIARARQCLPNLHDAILVPDGNHADPRYFSGPVMAGVQRFLTG